MLMLLIVVVVLVAVYGVATYNNLVGGRINIDEIWANIDVQLKRRYDLIPNLIETVKGYAKHEKNLLTDVTEARAHAMKAHDKGDLGKSADAENLLSRSLHGLMVQVENYPDLKADKNFLDLQNELTDTENKIQAARRQYNDAVGSYNKKCEMFPSKIVADTFEFKPRDFFEVKDMEERENVKVKF